MVWRVFECNFAIFFLKPFMGQMGINRENWTGRYTAINDTHRFSLHHSHAPSLYRTRKKGANESMGLFIVYLSTCLS